jgi:hypothetical protein
MGVIGVGYRFEMIYDLQFHTTNIYLEGPAVVCDLKGSFMSKRRRFRDHIWTANEDQRLLKTAHIRSRR